MKQYGSMHVGTQIILEKSCPHNLFDFLKKEYISEERTLALEPGTVV